MKILQSCTKPSNCTITHKEVVTHGCVLSTEVTDGLVLNHSVASFTKEVNPRLAKRPLIFNGRLANRQLNFLSKGGRQYPHCLLNIHYTGPVSYRNNSYMYYIYMEQHHKLKKRILNKLPSRLRVKKKQKEVIVRNSPLVCNTKYGHQILTRRSLSVEVHHWYENLMLCASFFHL